MKIKTMCLFLALSFFLQGCSSTLGLKRSSSDIRRDLVGRSAGSVKAKLGEPRTVLTEEPNQIWTYNNTGCAVFVYFDSSKKVRFAEERGNCFSSNKSDPQSDFDTLKQDNV